MATIVGTGPSKIGQKGNSPKWMDQCWDPVCLFEAQICSMQTDWVHMMHDAMEFHEACPKIIPGKTQQIHPVILNWQLKNSTGSQCSTVKAR